MNVMELMQESIRYDETFLAYAIFWGIQKNVFRGNHDCNSIDFNLVNVSETKEMMNQNILGIEMIRLYSMKMEDGRFAIVLAKQETDAKGKFLSEYGKLPRRVIDISEKMDTSFYFEKIGHRSIREIKESILEFPYLVMVY